MGLTTEVSGKYATSNALYMRNTVVAELTDVISNFITLPNDKTVAVFDVDGNQIGTVTVVQLPHLKVSLRIWMNLVSQVQ